MTTFSVARKLSGIFGRQSKEELIAIDKHQVGIGRSTEMLMGYPEWAVMQGVLDDVRGDAVKTFRKQGITNDDIIRANAIIGAVDKIEARLRENRKQGEAAKDRLARIEVKHG